MTREAAIARAEVYFDDGGFEADLSRRVAIASTSQEEAARPELRRYLADEVAPVLVGLGFACEVVENPAEDGPPFLCAERIEPGASLTLLSYAHGDVVRGLDEGWRDGLSPWSPPNAGARSSTGGGPPTTRASTASISARSPRSSRSAEGSASR